MHADAYFLLAGGCLLLAVLLPAALRSYAISPPLVLLVVGVAIGWTPLADGLQLDLVEDRAMVEHVTEITVLIALMGVGLALDRPLDLLKPSSWRAWSPTWRLLGIAMPLGIGGVALLGWALGLRSPPPWSWAPCWRRPTRCSPPTCRWAVPARRSRTRRPRTCPTPRTRPSAASPARCGSR